ncbi:MAG: hypothetical protein HZC49_05700 [Nitrospirae bacterium]|nr:hypothetical protein [Nitrospirota bacterium]
MERRHKNRTRVSLKSELIARHMRYSGLIENLSEDSLCMSITPPKTPLTIPEGTTFIVKFEGSGGDTHELQCKVRRPCKIAPGKSVSDVGMEIIRRPPEYLEFLKALKK